MSSNKSFSSETSDRYALALFGLAKENSELEAVEKNVRNLNMVYENNKDLENFVTNPTRSFEEHFQVINKLKELMNFSSIFVKFLSILVVKRRIFFLKKILISYLKLNLKNKGELNATLISSKKLSPEELKNLSEELSKTLNSNVSLNYSVDENLIGGLKIQIGSLMIDTSIRNSLKKYENSMLEI